MATKGCATCNKECGKGVSQDQTGSATKQKLCAVFCKVRKLQCEGKLGGKKPSQVAEVETRRANLKGAKVNQHRYVRYDNMPKSWNRAKVAKATIDRHLDKIEKQIMEKAGKLAATKAAKKAATAWLKLIPVVNVISTAYDVYDIASTGAEIYQEFRKARQAFSGDVYNIRPDVAIEGPNGQLQDIYDFKFDTDDWGKGQRQMYDRALTNAGSSEKAKAISQGSCKCDGPELVKGLS